jgi:hypothetical protein
MKARVRHLARLAVLGGLALGFTAASPGGRAAWAQSSDSSLAPIQNEALPPPPNTNANSVLEPGVAGSAAAGPIAPPVPEPPASATGPSVPAPSQWLPGHQAQLTVLDKIYGSASTVSAIVGTPFTVRFLTVTVLACLVRPPSLPPDAAAFLQVTDSHAAPGSAPEFRGWVFKAEPALSGMHDPATDISVDSCG